MMFITHTCTIKLRKINNKLMFTRVLNSCTISMMGERGYSVIPCISDNNMKSNIYGSRSVLYI